MTRNRLLSLAAPERLSGPLGGDDGRRGEGLINMVAPFVTVVRFPRPAKARKWGGLRKGLRYTFFSEKKL